MLLLLAVATYELIDTNSGNPGWYELVDPALGEANTPEPYLTTYPGATMPKGLHVQRGWTKKKTPESVLTTAEAGALVLRADVAKKVLEGTGLKTKPIDVRMTDGTSVDGWVIVVVDCWAPLDRKLARASFTGAKKKDGRVGLAAEVQAIDWSKERTPRAPIFRLVEAPTMLIARSDVMAKLRKAAKTLVRPGELTRPHPFAPRWLECSPFAISAKDADAAETAYWDLAAGRGTAAARKTACKHPLYATSLALEVDRQPESDTRAAACAHPLTAVLYALLVDKTSHAKTRAAANEHDWCAFRYARAIDRKITEAIAKRAIAAGFEDAEGIERLRTALA